MKMFFPSLRALLVAAAIAIITGYPYATPAVQTNAGQWIVVTAPALRSALEPLIDYRRKEGFAVTVLETTNILTMEQLDKNDGAALQSRIAALCKETKGLNYVLLAGGIIPRGTNDAAEATVPPLRGSTARMTDLLTDHGYGLPGDDGLASVAIGRFPARTAEEARHLSREFVQIFCADRPVGRDQPALSRGWRTVLNLPWPFPGGWTQV